MKYHVVLAVCFGSSSCCMMKFLLPIRLMHFSVNWQTVCFWTHSAETSSIMINDPLPGAVMQTQAMILWHYLHCAWLTRLYTLAHEQILSLAFPALFRFQNFYGSSLYFFVMSDLVFWFLGLMSGLYLVEVVGDITFRVFSSSFTKFLASAFCSIGYAQCLYSDSDRVSLFLSSLLP